MNKPIYICALFLSLYFCSMIQDIHAAYPPGIQIMHEIEEIFLDKNLEKLTQKIGDFVSFSRSAQDTYILTSDRCEITFLVITKSRLFHPFATGRREFRIKMLQPKCADFPDASIPAEFKKSRATILRILRYGYSRHHVLQSNDELTPPVSIDRQHDFIVDYPETFEKQDGQYHVIYRCRKFSATTEPFDAYCPVDVTVNPVTDAIKFFALPVH